MAIYAVGSLLRSTCTFADAAGTDRDPGTVSFQVRQPSGAETTYTYGVDTALVRDAVGIYHLDINLDAPGIWRYYWLAVGAYQAASIGSCTVLASGM